MSPRSNHNKRANKSVRHSNNLICKELYFIINKVKIHLNSCSDARNIRLNKPRVSEGCGLLRARGKRRGFLRFRR